MPDRILDLRLFRYALTSAEHGSFRRAAAALNVQQSTISRGVRNLEDRVGAELFERGHAGIRPTPAGYEFLQEATRGFDHLERAMRRAGALQRGEQGYLTIGLSVPILLLGDLLEQFHDAFAGVSVEIVETTTSAGLALVQQRKLDVAFVASTGASGTPRSIPMREARIMVVLPKSHPLAAARKVALKELFEERLMLSAGGLGPDVGDYLRLQMAAYGGEPKLQLHRTDQSNLIKLVARGFGVAVVVGPVPLSAPDGVVFVPLAGKGTISLCTVWMDSNPNPALKGLRDILLRHVQSSAEG